jgi:hypothetical protein
MAKQAMVLQWHGEKPQPISRETAARVIRGNRRQSRECPQLRIKVVRRYRETYIASDFLGVGCCIGRAR